MKSQEPQLPNTQVQNFDSQEGSYDKGGLQSPNIFPKKSTIHLLTCSKTAGLSAFVAASLLSKRL